MMPEVPRPRFARLADRLEEAEVIRVYGKVTQVVGLVAESSGPNARIGDVCLIDVEGGGPPVVTEVVGFRRDRTLLMPLGDMAGVRAGCVVRGTRRCLRVPAGPEVLGRVMDALGQPIDGRGPILASRWASTENSPPNPLERAIISVPFVTGVRALDGLLTIGVGQRVGIFAGSGVGKSTLLGMIARHGAADVNVIALIGERGREVREFIENDLGPEGLARSAVVVATSDEPALLRIKAALSATAIAEAFRNEGASVLLMMDSLTRFAMAQREVGLAVGEPPSSRGYTPSVFALLPKLLERAGCGARGAITGLYTVLVEGDDQNEPIADASRAILDGHVVLNRKLTGRGHYPPIDVLQSLSRVMPMVTSSEHQRHAARFRELLAAYADVEDLVSIGAYKAGSKPVADQAIARWDAINAFLRQGKEEATDFVESLTRLEELTRA